MEPDTNHIENSRISESLADRPDGWLLREWKAGDERAAEVLYDRYAIRLVGLVASRLNRRYMASIDPSEVVQSAMGSFFNAASQSRVEVSRSVSLWRLLATFARRKMARSIERQTAVKRGGDQVRVSLESVSPNFVAGHEPDSKDDADAFLMMLKAELPDDLLVVVEGILAGKTQRELAESLGIDERTIRRRLSRVRERLIDGVDLAKDPRKRERSLTKSTTVAPTLPRVNYNEFVLGRLIGSGGFGKVYRASMQSDGRTVAVKFLRKAFWQNENARRSFLREIDLASRIKHPGVIRYLGYGESPHGGPYLLSEWIDGQTLHAVTHSTTERFTGRLVQICQALKAVHQAGLVHGDLTPGNILVDDDDRITITDFGFSRATAARGRQWLGGTLGFAAPEQIDSSFGTVGTKTDIYAIGGLIHWFLFKQPPHCGAHPVDVLRKTLIQEMVGKPPKEGSDKTLNQIRLKTLLPAPTERTVSLDQIIHALRSDATPDHSSGSKGS